MHAIPRATGSTTHYNARNKQRKGTHNMATATVTTTTTTTPKRTNTAAKGNPIVAPAPSTAQGAAATPAVAGAPWAMPRGQHPAPAKAHVPQPGSTQACVLAALQAAGAAGCTVAQLQAALNTLPTAKQHLVLPLLRFMWRKQGYCFNCANGVAITLG